MLCDIQGFLFFGWPLTGLKSQGKVSIVSPCKVSAAEYGNVSLWEWINTFVWDLKRDFVKAVVRGAVRLPECLLRELPLYGNNEGCTNLWHFFFYLYFTKYFEPRISFHLTNFLDSGTKFCICIIKKGSGVCKTKGSICIKFITALSVLRNWVTYMSLI